jgi:hypothetical protein
MRVSIFMSLIWTIQSACPIGAKRVLKAYRESLGAHPPSQAHILHHSVNGGLNIIQRAAGGCSDPTPVTCPDRKTLHL